MIVVRKSVPVHRGGLALLFAVAATMTRTVLFSVLLAVVATGPLHADPPLRMSFDGDEIVVTELQPGADVVYFNISRFAGSGFAPYNQRRDEIIVDDDADGEIRISLEQPVPAKFLAVAVELASGRFDVLTPDGSPARAVAFPANSLHNGPGNRLDRLENARSYVELLLVRPGAGAWRLSASDGTRVDETRSSDGVVKTALEFMSPVVETGPPPPEEFRRDDLIIRVAPRDMEYYAARIVH